MIYKSVVKTVILYGRESWVVKEYIMKVLEALNNWADRKIAGATDCHTEDGEQEYPPVTDFSVGSGDLSNQVVN